MTSPISLLLAGVAQALGAAGVGSWNGPAGALSGAWPIALMTPPETTQSITLTTYDLLADPKLSDRLIGLNVRIVGDLTPASVIDKAADVYAVLQGRRTLPNGQLINQMFWQSATPLGPNAARRQVASINYYVQLNVAFSGSE